MISVIKVVIVDDSAFVRKVVREMLSRSPFIEVVGMCRDGAEALAMVEKLNPDVVTCDLIMPNMDGVEFVRRQMASRPLPILMLTASNQDCAQVIEALEEGAVDMVRKPSALANDELLAIRQELVEKIKGAARAPHLSPRRATPPAPPRLQFKPARNVDIVVIGISTGGPQALRYLLAQFQADFPVPIAIVLHMPVGYTAMFAEKLNEISKLMVKEAAEGDLVQPGIIILAQAGSHLQFKRSGSGNVLAQLTSDPYDKPHKPSVDVMFQSAAEVYKARVLGVVMTGMGDDGKQGAAWIKAQGGKVITEAEESCVIYGMPKMVVECGLSDASFTLETMAEGITKYL